MNKKKLLALLMALVMTLSLLPVTAFAEGDNVAKIGSTEYATLEEAISAAQTDDTVTLLKNVTLDATLELNKSFTLDLGGYTLSKTLASATDNKPLIKALSGNVTVKNGYIVYDISTYTGTGATDNANVINVGMNMSNGIYSGGDCELTLKDVNVTHTFPKGKLLSAVYVGSGKLNVIDSSISATNVSGNTKDQYLIYTTAHASAQVNPYVTIDGNTTLETYSSPGIHAIWLQGSNDTLKILGDGVTIKADATWKPYSWSTSYAYAVNNQSGATVTIEGGKFAGKVWQNNGTITVSGGLYSYAQGTSGQKNKITLYEGYEYLENTDPLTKDAYPYKVAQSTNYVAEIDDVQYETLQDAINAAVTQSQESNNTVKVELLRDVTDGTGLALFNTSKTTYPAATSAKVEIDFGTHTYTVAAPAVGSTGTENQALHFESGNTVTLTNGTINMTNDSNKLAAFNMIMQNYGSLTIDNMTIDGTGIEVATYGNNYSAPWGGSTKPQFNFNNSGTSVISNSAITVVGDMCIDDTATVTIEDDAVINANKIVTKGTDDRLSGAKPTITVENGAQFKLAKGVSEFEALLNPSQTLGNADGNGVFTVAAAVTYVAQIGNNQYATLAEAVAEVPTTNTATTIELLCDSTGEGIDFKAGQNVIVDFKGYTYTVTDPAVGSTGTKNQGIRMLQGSKVTLKDGKINADASATGLLMLLHSYADVTLDNLDVDASTNENIYCAVDADNGTLNITGDSDISVQQGGYAVVIDYWKYGTYNGVTVNFNGYTGTVNGQLVYGSESEDITADNNSNLVLTIDGGTFNTGAFLNYPATIEGKYNANWGTPVHTVSAPNITISGGTFNSCPAEAYLAENYMVKSVTGGYQVVPESEAVAQIGTIKYATLAEAISAVPKDGTKTTITLLDGVDGETIAINGGRNIVLDLNSHTVSAKSMYVLNGALEVKGGVIANSVDVYGLGTDGSRSSTFTLDSDATISADYGVILREYPNTNAAYNATVTIDGDVNGCIWVMGNIYEGDSVVNVNGTVEAIGDVGLALNGFATVNVNDDATIQPIDDDDQPGTGIEVRAGTLYVNGGQIMGHGSPASASANGNGTTSAGAGIAISTYNLSDINVNISGGTISGYSPLYLVNTTGKDHELNVSVSGGTFTLTNEGTKVVAVNETNPEDRAVGFITGGTFSGEPAEEYIAETYAAVQPTGESVWKVGKVQATSTLTGHAAVNDDAAIADGVARTGLTYSVNRTITDANNGLDAEVVQNSVKVLGTTNDKSLHNTMESLYSEAPVAEGQTAVGGFSASNLKDFGTLKNVVESAVAASGDSAVTGITFALVCEEPTAKQLEGKSAATKKTVEVHPEALAYKTVDNVTTLVGSYMIPNDALNGAMYIASLNLGSNFANQQVRLVHRLDNGTQEILGVYTADESGKITGSIRMTSFSPVDVETFDAVTVDSAYLYLDGDIAVEYEMVDDPALTALFAAGGKIRVQMANNNGSYENAETKYFGSNEKIIFGGIDAPEMHLDIKLTAVVPSGNDSYAEIALNRMTAGDTSEPCEGNAYVASVQTLLNWVANAEDASDDVTVKFAALARAMSLYGDYASILFKTWSPEKSNLTQITDHAWTNANVTSVTSKTKEDLQDYYIGVTKHGEDNRVEYAGATLSLNANTTLRLYFDLGIDIKSINVFEVDENGVETKLTKYINGSRLVVKYANIAAKDLDQTHNIVIRSTSGDLLMSVNNISALGYAYAVMNGDASEALKNTVRAMVDYNAAAKAYFAVKGNNE